jgi:ATP-dependent exoDNAse (exonuclease V) beta subunit
MKYSSGSSARLKDAVKTTGCFTVWATLSSPYTGGAVQLQKYLNTCTVVWQVTSTSYRSSQVVLDAVNRLYNLLPYSSLCERSQNVADWWKVNYEPHSAARQLPGYVRVEQFADEAQQPTTREDDEGDGAPAGAVSETSAGAAARRIYEIVMSAPNASIGILMRTNERVAQMIFQLKELGVPASAEGKSLLTDDPAVLLLLSAVKLADHPADSASAFHLLTSPLAATLGIEEYSRPYKASSELRKQFVCNGYASTLMKLAAKLASTVDRRSARRLEQFILLADEFDKSKRVRPAEFLELAETRQMEDPSSSQVRVMTIHAAKGLEFDIAVLPELEKSIESRADCVVERDIETMQVTAAMLYPDAVVRGICLPLQAIWEAQQNRDIREALCLLYVAMTRPRHALYILLPAKVSKFSLATFVIECLAPSAAPTEGSSTVTLYEAGDEKWMRQLTNEAEPKCTPASPSPYHVDVTGWPPHLLKSERPSAMRQYRATLADTLLGVDARAESLRQGVALHAMLCLVEWVDAAIPPAESVELAVRRAISDAQPAELVQWHRRFQLALQFEAIKQLLSFPSHEHNEQVEVWRERQFLEMHQGRLLTGVFDRVVVRYRDGVPQCADVIDYKTDELTNGAAKTRAVQRHTHQLEIYRTALSIMLGIPLQAVTAKLVFTETGDVVEV